VSEFDCLLLKHVCWSNPEEQGKVDAWIVDQLISQTETKQLRYLLLGVFTRCCKAWKQEDGQSAEGEEGSDVADLVEILTAKLGAMREQQRTVKHSLAENIWLGEDEAAAVAGHLAKPLEISTGQVETLLRDALTLALAYKEKVPLYVVADLLTEYWNDFIRKGNIEDVKPLGIKPIT